MNFKEIYCTDFYFQESGGFLKWLRLTKARTHISVWTSNPSSN